MRSGSTAYHHPPSSLSRVLSHIRSCRGDISASSIADALSGQGKKKGKGGKVSHEIEELLASLHGMGYLTRKKKVYRLNPDFITRGIIRVNSTGSAAIVIDDGLEVLVRKENTGNARSGDSVAFELDDFKKGIFWARVGTVSSRKRERQLAKIEQPLDKGIILSLLDTPGSVKVWAPRTSLPVTSGYFAFVSLEEEMTPRGQKCEIRETFPPWNESYDAQRMIVKHGLPQAHKDYKELKNIEEIITRESSGRKDYRRLFTVTIDGEYSKDFDDAISLETSGSMNRLYVHIADVSAFVKKGSQLDREALERGNSYYIGNQVVPMLPETLSNELCSLKQGLDRLTLTAELIIDAKGALRDMSFHRGVITVDRRLTYTQAHDIVLGKTRDNSLRKHLTAMDKLSLLLKKMRMNRGRVDLNIMNEDVIYDGDRTVDIRFSERLVSHRIIEEFMLSANEAASKVLREAAVPTLYRIHENISEEKLTALTGFFRTIGFKFDRGIATGLALQNVVDAVAGKEFEQVVNFIILRSFMQAFYGIEPAGHFGLGFRDYTHFTSPIRRFPDLVVHRCIKSLIDKARHPYSAAELTVIGEKNSVSERVAMKAERDLLKLKACRLLSCDVGRVFDVVVSSVSKFGLNVALIDRPIEGMVPMWTLTDDYYMVNEDEFTVIGKRLGKRFRIGDRLKAVLAGADINSLRLDFTLR
jgi:ribonuclease R